MTKKSESNEKICGTCRYHNTYEYPHTVFCFARFSERQNPVVSIYQTCKEWEVKVQDCYCLQDASKKDKKKRSS